MIYIRYYLEKILTSRKTIPIIVITVILAIAIGVLVYLYNNNSIVQNWMDVTIFRKEVRSGNLPTIDIEEGEVHNIYAFNRTIGILNNNDFRIYNRSGSKVRTLSVEITTPIFASKNRFLAIAEDRGRKLYLINGRDIAWENTVDGNISQIHVNKNGFVAVTVVDTSYRTVVVMFNRNGNEMFRTYLSTTRVTDVAISKDNRYLALAEIDTSGILIQSSIRIISIDKAKTNPEDSIIRRIESDVNDLLVGIQYTDRNRLIAKYTNKINVIDSKGDVKNIVDNADKKIIFSSIRLSNHAVNIEEAASEQFKANSVLSIVNVGSGRKREYVANQLTKELYTRDNVIAINLGTEVEFVGTNGRLRRRYMSNQEITNITVSRGIAGIIYRDRVEIVRF